MDFFAKSKTFLVGEYSVLMGASAIVLATPPEFHLRAEKSARGLVNVYGETPFLRLYLNHIGFLRNLSIHFTDPHEGRGGFGASSAQFAMLYKLYLSVSNQKFDLKKFLAEYKSLSEKSRIPPSGADCVTQYFNRHTYFDAGKIEQEEIKWNFEDITISIFKTSMKIPTHSHIASLQKIEDSKLNELNENVQAVKAAIINKNHELLCSGIQNFYEILCSLNLVIENTRTIVEELLKYDQILAAKGCGALCADTIIAVHRKNADIRSFCESKNLRFIADICG